MTSCSFASGLKLLMLQHHVVVPLLHGARERCTNSAVVISSHVCVYICLDKHTHTNTIGGSVSTVILVILLQNILSSHIIPRLRPIMSLFLLGYIMLHQHF